MEENNYIYELELSVRDYECDLQGIVNNANYQHYLEHARHEFLLSKDIDFAALHEQGTDLIVSRIEIDYKTPLRSRDKFVVKLNMRKEGRLRIIFDQDIKCYIYFYFSFMTERYDACKILFIKIISTSSGIESVKT